MAKQSEAPIAELGGELGERERERGERGVSEGLINGVNVGYLVSPHPAVGMALMRRAVPTQIGCYFNAEDHCAS